MESSRFDGKNERLFESSQNKRKPSMDSRIMWNIDNGIVSYAFNVKSAGS